MNTGAHNATQSPWRPVFFRRIVTAAKRITLSVGLFIQIGYMEKCDPSVCSAVSLHLSIKAVSQLIVGDLQGQMSHGLGGLFRKALR